jgi:hypothetical protein
MSASNGRMATNYCTHTLGRTAARITALGIMQVQLHDAQASPSGAPLQPPPTPQH